jgi:hypothetical protein
MGDEAMSTNPTSERTSKFFAESSYWTFPFLLNAACAASLLIADSFIIAKHWNSLSEDVATYLVFWLGLIAILGPFVSYTRTYRELRIHCQAVLDPKSNDARNLAEALLCAQKALDGQMLQYFAVILTLMLCFTKVIHA